MKIYDVTIIEKNDFHWKNIVRVTVDNCEHPGKKAIEYICKNGYMRKYENQKIIKIKRIQ